MKMKSLRQAFVMAVVFAGTAALMATPVLAQQQPPAPGPPVCGGVASLMNHQIYRFAGLGTFPKGANIVSIPSVSPINNTPTNHANNGFHDLCRRFGLTGTTSQIQQFDPRNPAHIQSFTCDQPISSDDFTIGQAVYILPSADATGRLPGVECARPYTTYVEGLGTVGDNLWPMPITVAGVGTPVAGVGGLQDVCNMLGLPGGTSVIRFDALGGNQRTHLCGAVPQAADVSPSPIGEGLLIRPGSTTTGTPVIF